MNQELKQYLQFFVDYRQKGLPEQLASAEFAINKAYLTTKVSPFIENYRREMRIKVDLRRKGKMEKVTEFVEKMRKVQEEVRVALKRAQKKMKRQVNRKRKEAKEQKVGDRIMLSIKDLVFKERLARKLVDKYVGLYTINKVIFANAVKLRLLTLMRIHLVVNVSWIV